MSTIATSDWLVILGGLAAIALVNWYFFVAGRGAVATAIAPAMSPDHAGSAGVTAGPAEITITVNGGYSPQQTRVKAGAPLRLVFDRKDTGSCSDEVVFPDFGIRRFLPTGSRTAIEIVPPNPGRYEFTCGMGMHRGVIVAE